MSTNTMIYLGKIIDTMPKLDPRLLGSGAS